MTYAHNYRVKLAGVVGGVDLSFPPPRPRSQDPQITAHRAVSSLAVFLPGSS